MPFKKHTITARILRNYIHDPDPNGYSLINSKDKALFEKIENIVMELPPSENDWDIRKLWISIPRGSIDDFSSFEYYRDEGMTYEEFVEYWKGLYPDDADWYVFQYEKSSRGERFLAIDQLVLFYGDEYKGFRKPTYYHTDLLEWLVRTIKDTVDSVKAGTYHERVLKNLPMGYRRGVVKRSDVWESGYWSKRKDLDGTTVKDIRRFTELVNSGIEQKPKGRLDSVTVNSYLELCSICFRIRGEDTSGMSIIQQYRTFADGRDDGLLNLDPDDSDQFRIFCSSSTSHHIWEIRPGHTFSCMLLCPEYDEHGWFYTLRGCFDRTDFIHIALELNSMGIPLQVDKAQKVLRALRGEDYIGIVPRKRLPVYCEHLFPEHDVLDCISFNDEIMEKFGDKISWYDVNTFYPVNDDP